MAVPVPTPEERALHWTIELLVTSQALSGDARMKILAALSPKIQGGQLPDTVTARLLLDSLNMRTNSFTRVSPEDAEFVFESLITLGDIVRAEGERADGLELPEPPLHLTAMSYCETAVGALRRLAANGGGSRNRADAIADFDERCDTYDLNDVYVASPWVDKRTLENLQIALKRDANALLRGDVDPARVLEKHHASGKLLTALAAYCKKMIDAMGPAFLERVAADVGAGIYAPDAEYSPINGRTNATAPTGIVLDRADAAGDHANVEMGFVRGGGADDADETDEEVPEAEAEAEDDVDETASEEETRGRGKRKRPLSPAAPAAPASRVVALAAAARGAAAGDAWTNLAKHAELDGANAERHSSENDAYAFDGSEEEGDESPGAEVARRRRQKLGAALGNSGARRTGGGGGATTIAWGASQGDGVATQGGTPGVAAGDPVSRAARVTPGSLGRGKYTRWSAAEEEYFLTLCEKHGEGKWAQMLAEGQQAGKLRAELTSVNLKDKYRNLKTNRATRRPSRT
jgi:hypothetical protein